MHRRLCVVCYPICHGSSQQDERNAMVGVWEMYGCSAPNLQHIAEESYISTVYLYI